jgi:hypothetical protein
MPPAKALRVCLPLEWSRRPCRSPLAEQEAIAGTERIKRLDAVGSMHLLGGFPRSKNRLRLTAEVERRQAERLRRGWRTASLQLGVMWIVLTVLLIFGSHARNHVDMGFYSAGATILPVLVVAGFVEIAAMRSPRDYAGVFWRMLALVIPAAAGVMGSLWALAHKHSTSWTLIDAVGGLVFTATVLLGMIVTTRMSHRGAV